MIYGLAINCSYSHFQRNFTTNEHTQKIDKYWYKRLNQDLTVSQSIKLDDWPWLLEAMNMLTSRPRDKKGQDKEKRAAKARTFQVRRRSRRRRRRSRRRRYRRPSLGSFRPWPSLSITAAVIQINSSMIVKVVMIDKILIATCFDPISPGCPGFIDSIAVSQFHE